MTWLSKNAHKEREQAEGDKESEDYNVQRASRALQAKPIPDDDKNRCVIYKTNQQKHPKD